MPTFSVDGNSAAVAVKGERATIFASGTWGGGTLNIQTYGEDAVWHTISSQTADGYWELKNPGAQQWRVNLASSTTPSLWYEIR